MENEKYQEIYVISYVGEYTLKHAKILANIFDLEEFDTSFDTDLANTIRKTVKKVFNIEEEFTFISRLSGTNSELKKIAFENSEYLIELLDQPYGIGADDGHFDYYPDLVDQFRQLCVKINEIELYNETIKKIKAHKEYSEDEEVEFEELSNRFVNY